MKIRYAEFDPHKGNFFRQGYTEKMKRCYENYNEKTGEFDNYNHCGSSVKHDIGYYVCPIPEMVKTPLTHMQFLKWQVYQYNHLEKQNKDGYECTACKNRRFFALINSEGDFALRPCTCNGIIERQRKEAQEQEDKRGRRR